MKKLIALALILISVFALCACGEAAPAASEPVVTEKIVEVEKEVPVIPEEYARFKDVVDALVAEEYDKAQELIEEMKPAPEIIEVKIDQDNFLDYFEYVEWNNKQIEKTSDGKIKSAYFTPQYVLKAEYAIAQEKADECSVEVGVKYITNFYYQAKTMKKVTIDYDALTFSTTAKPDQIYNDDELLTGRYYGGEEGRMTCILPFSGHVYMLSGDLCQIINQEDVSIVSAEGTIYLCSIPAEAGEPAADEKEAITVALKPGEILPAEFEQFKDVLDLLVNAGFDGAQALIEGMKPVPEPLPVVEVAITKDNFFDYFEYVDIPGIYIENGTEKDSAGKITRVVVLSGFYLRPEYAIAEEKLNDCYVDIGIKWKRLDFSRNKNITVDLENRSYTVTGKPSSSQKYDDMRSACLFEYPGEPAMYGIIFSSATILSDGKKQPTMIKDQESFDLVSAEGTLYLYG